MTKPHSYLKSMVIPLGLLGLVFTTGIVSNLVTIILYRKNLIASGAYDSAITSHYHVFNVSVRSSPLAQSKSA